MPATVSDSWSEHLAAGLQQRRQQHLYRRPRVVASAPGPELIVDGRPLLSFSSNDYLGLAADPRIKEAFCQAVQQWGSGSGAAHLVTGHAEPHQQLEQELARFTGRDRALLFSSGYMANLALQTALLEPGDSIILDKLDHASLIDGARLSGARWRRFPHADVAAAEQRLVQSTGKKLLAVDAVFSMDGDLAPLPQLADLCQRHDAWLLVDDAHGFGVLGEHGAGSLRHWGLGQAQAPVLMGTLGKAFGTAGAFVAGSEVLIETLIQRARTYIYTTALPAALAQATRVSLQIVAAESGRRQHLRELVRCFRQELQHSGLELLPSETPIQPIIAGTAEQAVRWSQQLERQGILVTAIRPPTVPKGQARLRITFSAAHRFSHLQRLIHALRQL